MNDSRRRQTTLRASLLLAPLLASCGGPGGSSSASEAKERANTTPTTQSVTVERPASAPANHGDQVDPVERGGGYPAAAYMCTRDPVAFDLSSLQLAGGTPQIFASAWRIAKDRSQFPGFVVAYSGTMFGPELSVRVGAVRKVKEGIYAFMRTVSPGEVVHVGVEQADRYHVRTAHYGNVVTAFGTQHQREGFVISSISIDGRLDETCRTFRQVHVSMTLPVKENEKQRFGGVILGDVLGTPTAIDHDGKSAWRIELTGEQLDNMMFSL